MPALVPADVDLRDFAFMPLDVHRLLTSETWVLGSGDERAAAMTLWLTSWHQVPAGSLPENERMLERLADCKSWKKSKPHALRGWESGGDGRLYHPVVCEKALEAWLEKLAQRLSSGAGNAKRWGAEFDSTALEVRMQEARDLLITLNPDSRALTKRKTSGLPKASRPDPDPIPSGSQEKGQGQGQGEGISKSGSAAPPPLQLVPADASPAKPAQPSVIEIHVVGGTEVGITQAQVDEFAKLYPAVDVMAELRKMRGWAFSHPEKRKTKGGLLRFVNTWLAKEQDRGGSNHGLPLSRTGTDPAPGSRASMQDL